MTDAHDAWPDDAFDQLWEAYPRKMARRRAESALARLRRSGGVDFAAVLSGVARLKAELREPRFIPFPATWLNDRRWEDEPQPTPEPAASRVPPHNVEAEQALLGAILVNNDAFDRVSDFLRPEHFAEEIHRRIFEVVSSLVQAGKIAKPITLKLILGEQDIGDGVTVPRYLACLAAKATTIINAAAVGRRILGLWQRRLLIAIAEEVVDLAFDAPIEVAPQDLLNRALLQLISVFGQPLPFRGMGARP